MISSLISQVIVFGQKHGEYEIAISRLVELVLRELLTCILSICIECRMQEGLASVLLQRSFMTAIDLRDY